MYKQSRHIEAINNILQAITNAPNDNVVQAELENYLLLLFKDGLETGSGAKWLQAIDDSGAGERWRPLREALAAAVAGKAEILLDVAPEVRKPALDILAMIAPDLPISPALR